MTAERDPLDELLGSVSDGRPVDWDEAVRRAVPSELARVEALRDVNRIGQFNRGLQRDLTAGTPDATGEGVANVPRWGDLLLLELCGAGAQAEVYRAWDPGLRREVALKLIRPEAARAAGVTGESPLLAEGRALARIRHPHVVSVHGIDCREGRVGLWMELVRGVTLEQHVTAQGPLLPEEVVRLGQEIGSALAAVHAAGLLHRDVKPANVVRDPDGRFVLTDFGLGRPRDGDGGSSGWAAGSPMYMAPELLVGAPPDPRTDLYALGMLLWFALTGAHPFPQDSLDALRLAAANGPRPGLGERRPDLPAALVAAVEQSVAPAPARRTASARRFVESLGTAVPGAARADEAPTSTPRPQRRRAFTVTIAVALTAAAAFAIRQWVTVPASGPGDGTYAVEAAFLRHGPEAPSRLVSGDAVAPGDRLSLEWRASRRVWVYVLNEDEHGEAYLLFPQPRFDVHNPLPADSTLVLPGAMAGSGIAWTVTSAGGRETFMVVASPEPLREFEEGATGFAAPDPDRPIAYAAVPAASIERLRGVGGLAAVPLSSPSAVNGAAAIARFRALSGGESGVTGLWVREIVLRNPR